MEDREKVLRWNLHEAQKEMSKVLCAVNKIKPMSLVKITKCSIKEYIGFVGTLYTNLRCFHANAAIFSMTEVLMIDKDQTCIGIIGDNGAFWWTKESDFDVEVCLINAT